jgi:uncharacterized protein (TIGR03083 family)
MLAQDRLALLAADNAVIARCAGADLDAVVEPCPGWTMVELVKHVGNGQSWFEVALRTMATEESQVRCVPPPEREGLVDWFLQVNARLDATVRATGEEPPMRMLWNTDGRCGGADFLRRRAGNEAVVHRWDAERAVGGAGSPVPTELAVDCLDELLVRWLPWAAAAGRQAQGGWSGQSIELRADDRSWRVDFSGPGSVQVSEGRHPGPATAAVAGAASPLLLFAMNRLTPEEAGLHVEGDRRLLSRWTAEVRFGSRVPVAQADRPRPS